MGILDWLLEDKEKKQEEEEEYEDPSPYFMSPLIRISGQPGTGKTMFMARIGFYAGYTYRLPIFVQDTKGEIKSYQENIIRNLENKKDNRSKKKLDYVKNKITFSYKDDGSEMLAVIRKIQKMKTVSRDKSPSLYFIVDEAGTLRRNGGEEFWFLASTLRNIGATALATCHKEVGEGGVPPIAREATRAVVLFPQYKDPEFFDVKISNADIPPGLGNKRAYIDAVDRKVNYFDMPESDDVIKPDTIPETIIHPVNTSRIKRLVF